jgi:hypothetical protein
VALGSSQILLKGKYKCPKRLVLMPLGKTRAQVQGQWDNDHYRQHQLEYTSRKPCRQWILRQGSSRAAILFQNPKHLNEVKKIHISRGLNQSDY